VRRGASKLAAAQEKMRQRHTVPEYAPVSVHSLPIELDKHYTTQEVAEMWGRSVWSVRRMFKGVPLPRIGKRRIMMIPARLLRARLEQITRLKRSDGILKSLKRSARFTK
jgi:hypothetical protein